MQQILQQVSALAANDELSVLQIRADAVLNRVGMTATQYQVAQLEPMLRMSLRIQEENKQTSLVNNQRLEASLGQIDRTFDSLVTLSHALFNICITQNGLVAAKDGNATDYTGKSKKSSHWAEMLQSKRTCM